MNTSNKTLLQILVEELPKNGGWLRDVKTMTQDRNGNIWGYDCVSPYLDRGDFWSSKSGEDLVRNSIIEVRDLAVDWNTAIITREQYEAALAASKEPLTGTGVDGWVDWPGGECPVPCGTMVDVKHRDGCVYKNVPALGSKNRVWDHGNNQGDIIAYRLHKPHDATTRANDYMLPQDFGAVADEADLNDCIGQPQEDIKAIRAEMLEVLDGTGLEVKLRTAMKLVDAFIDAGYRKQ